MRLEGRAALVTGGSRGIGRAIAACLAKEGADVAVNYVSRPDLAQEAVAEIHSFFTKSLAKELATNGITVNAVAPGFIETEMVAAIPEKVRTRLLGQIPMKRFGRADEVGRAVVYLASEDADYITGAELSINGGLFM